ncbi:MAG: hypothetical protein ABF905_07070 [Gluconobacter oxydans]
MRTSFSIPFMAYILFMPSAYGVDIGSVCIAYQDAEHQFVEANASYNDSIADNDSNGVRRENAINAAKKNIDDLFFDRNNKIFKIIGPYAKNRTQISVDVDSIESSDEDRGSGLKTYAILHAHLDCPLRVGVDIYNIDPTLPAFSRVSSLNTGDKILVSGTFSMHDLPAQRPADAIQWAGPVWGLFFNLRTDSFEKPLLEMTASRIK